MSTIAVFGGTGALGRECVYQALQSGYNVIVLARDPLKMLIPPGSGGATANLPLKDPKLKVIEGDVTMQSSVDAIFQSATDICGVVVALGGKTRLVGPTMLTDGTKGIVSSMKRLSNAKRIAVVTAIGTGDSEQQAPLFYKALMYTVMRSVFADKNAQERLFLSPTGPGHDLE
jgi:nucleoside-diphosphate-sugar epimerase